MRESFSFARFARLFIKHTAEHYRAYLMAMSVLVGFLVLCGVFLFFVIPFAPDPGFQTASYAIVMLVAGGLFTSTVFADYGDNRTAIPALTLPATSFEKFLVGWVWSYPIFLLLYTGIYYLALVGLSSFRHWDEGQRFMYFTLRQPQLIVILVLFTELHALALFGAIYFRKLQFIRTGFVFFVALALAMIFNTLLLRAITGAAVEKAALPYTNLNFYIAHKYYSIDTGDNGSLLVQGVFLLSAISMWVAAYYRLKEKRV
jgi:hypothetical protein